MSLPQDSSGTCPEGFEVQTNPFRSRAGTTPDIERFRAFYIPGTLQQLLICARGECSVDNALILPQAFRTLSPRVPSSSGVHMLSDSRRKTIIASSANFSHRRINKSPQNRGLDLAMSKRTAGLPPRDLTIYRPGTRQQYAVAFKVLFPLPVALCAEHIHCPGARSPDSVITLPTPMIPEPQSQPPPVSVNPAAHAGVSASPSLALAITTDAV